MANYKFNDNSKEFVAALLLQSRKGLEQIGLVAEGYAKLNLEDHVITGRLRNSISYAVTENGVYIGSNVEYAPYVEYGARGRKPVHYLKNAAANHTAEYKQILNDALKE